MMSIIRGVRRPKRSARIPKMSAPTGRSINVSVMVNAIAGRATLKSFAIRSVTNVTRKKSKASSVQPRKLARKVLRCSRLSELNRDISRGGNIYWTRGFSSLILEKETRVFLVWHPQVIRVETREERSDENDPHRLRGRLWWRSSRTCCGVDGKGSSSVHDL